MTSPLPSPLDPPASSPGSAPLDSPAPSPSSSLQLIDAICALLPVVLKREVTGADADTALLDALGLNSTTGLELVLELEERLGLEISVEDLGRDDFTTVGSLAAYVAGNLLADA